mmetsp:Transcript_957/g.1982  ORF Transcript_957/g.1982 Transcript_957/m.1982 type:complete len:283 (+) Transcript_957:224-1072(+)
MEMMNKSENNESGSHEEQPVNSVNNRSALAARTGLRRFSLPPPLIKSFSVVETQPTYHISGNDMNTTTSPAVADLPVPLAACNDDEEEKVDLGGLTTDDEFKNLRDSDPFLFYSIPEVRRRSLTFTDDFLSDGEDSDDDEDDVEERIASFHPHLGQAAVSEETNSDTITGDESTTARRRSSYLRANTCPAGMLANAEIRRSLIESGSLVVRRRHRLTMEAHPTLVVDDIMSSLGSASMRGLSIDNDGDESSIDFCDDGFKVEPLRRVLKSMSSKNVLGHGKD